MKMIIINRITLCCLLLTVLFVQSANAADYLLRQGDRLDISVWGDETLSKELRVLPDGSISFPLTGRLEVAGRSSTQVRQMITAKLKKYLPDPEVTVIVIGTEGSKVYILGKVNNPGPIALTGPMTVLHALSIAGGFDKFADLDGIKILRRTQQTYKVLPVDYSNLLKGKDLHSNYILSADDTILVP